MGVPLGTDLLLLLDRSKRRNNRSKSRRKKRMKTIELLAPAKDLEHGRAAVLCGADAVYAGAPRFGARASAGMRTEDIGELCDFAHGFGARVYVAMNTLLYEDELAEAEEIAARVCDAGADGLIVQDMAFLRMEGLPPVETHASTQTFNMSAERIKFLAEAGFSRVILERALSLAEITEIHTKVPEIGLEAFIHGAICVSYSGRCYMSRTMGPRSGNRGVCMQACRLPYNLLDENIRPIMKDRHLLSVQDMNLTDHLEGLIDAGVSSFKIEGRLKDIDYVKNIVTWYRRRLDGIIARRDDLQRASQGTSMVEFEPSPGKSFSRGATSYFIADKKNKVASFDTPKSSGEYVGKVSKTGRDFFICDTALRLNNGDGICFFDGNRRLTGTNINKPDNGRIYPNRMEGIAAGTEIYRNYDIKFVSAVERSRMRRTIAVAAKTWMEAGRISLELCETADDLGSREKPACASVSLAGAFDPAQNPERAEETLRTQIAKTGETTYSVQSINIEWDVPLFVPVSIINKLRRGAVEKLTEARLEAIRQEKAAHRRRPENMEAPYPAAVLTGEDNVTNPLAGRFYRDHGVTAIEQGYDLADDLTGKRVMQMRYCPRKEIGQCLKEKPSYTEKLYIENGLNVYELLFDCATCTASLVYKGKRDKKSAK